MLLTDPEVESSLLISLDEGASYQKHSLAFDILSLLFHPEQEDWILAYSHDQKVMCNCQDEIAEITTKNVTGKKKKNVWMEVRAVVYGSLATGALVSSV